LFLYFVEGPVFAALSDFYLKTVIVTTQDFPLLAFSGVLQIAVAAMRDSLADVDACFSPHALLSLIGVGWENVSYTF
jgi:hypothetical protein